jgi:hypothetical protein
MPLKHVQARSDANVLKEIKWEYPGAGTGPGHNWKESNFSFAQPSDAWMHDLKPLATISVEMKAEAGTVFDVYLVGETTAGPVRTNVGKIKDAS